MDRRTAPSMRMEASTMAHAGTMDLGGSAQANKTGGRWTIVAQTLLVVVATFAAVSFASNAGRVGSTPAKPEPGQAAAVSSVDSQARDSDLNGIFDRAHAAPFA